MDISTMALRTVVRGGRIVTMDGELRADIVIDDHQIVALLADSEGVDGDNLIDATDLLILPVWWKRGFRPRGCTISMLASLPIGCRLRPLPADSPPSLPNRAAHQTMLAFPRTSLWMRPYGCP